MATVFLLMVRYNISDHRVMVIYDNEENAKKDAAHLNITAELETRYYVTRMSVNETTIYLK